MDGTLIRPGASHKSFVPKDGPPLDKSGAKSNPDVDCKMQKRSNDTHASTTDPDARLAATTKKGESIVVGRKQQRIVGRDHHRPKGDAL